MALSSMTGFARADGVAGTYVWAWELKSVNAKGMELRLRLPPGWDAIEIPARNRAGQTLTRGTVYANLSVSREGVAPAGRGKGPVIARGPATRAGRAAEPRRHPRAARHHRGERPGRERGGPARGRGRDHGRLRQCGGWPLRDAAP